MSTCEDKNQTVVTEFFLLGFQVGQRLRLLLFSLLFFINCCTLCGNLLIIVLVCTSKTLHTPMYFFITQLSINDILVTSDIVPVMLYVLLKNGGTITYIGCIAQFFFFCASEAFECFLLTVMAYDRYLAICNPLHYPSIMTTEYCIKLTILCWLAVFVIVFINTFILVSLKFCGKYTINYFFCDIVPLIDIACSGTYFAELEVSVLAPPVLFAQVILIIISYKKIIATILRIQSNISRQKAFSTCSSHLIVVSIFYCSLFSVYVVPAKGQTLTISKILSLLYTVCTPFINPMIYSLRNKDILKALQEKHVQTSLF